MHRAAAPVLLLLGLAIGTAPGASASEPLVALRGEGHVGYVRFDSDSNVFVQNEEGVQGGGGATASAVFGPAYVQLDVLGDVQDYDSFDDHHFGAGIRMGWRDSDRGALGVVGTYNASGDDEVELGGSELDTVHGGIEAEAFLGRTTLGLAGGYVNQDGSDIGLLVGEAVVYPTDRLRLRVTAGAFGFEESENVAIINAGIELLALDLLGLFARWEGAFSNDGSGDSDVRQNVLMTGVRLYWGADDPTLITYDRSHFKKSCIGFTYLAGRRCL